MIEQKNCAIVPGGFEEASFTSNKEYRLFAKRKGFIKYALKYGYRLHPVFIFNENKVFKTFDGLTKLRLLLNKIKLAGTVFFSKYFLIMPDPN